MQAGPGTNARHLTVIMRFLSMVVVTALVGANSVRAQDTRPDGDAGRRIAAPVPPIKAEDLPISITRIQQKLVQLPRSTEYTHGLKLEYYIEVIGKAPQVDFFSNFNVKSGPVPFTPPTHQDFLNAVTPQEFRTPPVDLSALMAWLAQRFGKTPR